MTRSQQELRFETGTAESVTSEELAEQGLETLNASPSRVLQRQSLLIRDSLTLRHLKKKSKNSIKKFYKKLSKSMPKIS